MTRVSTSSRSEVGAASALAVIRCLLVGSSRGRTGEGAPDIPAELFCTADEDVFGAKAATNRPAVTTCGEVLQWTDAIGGPIANSGSTDGAKSWNRRSAAPWRTRAALAGQSHDPARRGHQPGHRPSLRA